MSRKNKKVFAKEFGTFLRLYGRRAQKGHEPNDRPYDPAIEHELRRLKPEELDRLINGDADERLPTKISKLPTPSSLYTRPRDSPSDGILPQRSQARSPHAAADSQLHNHRRGRACARHRSEHRYFYGYQYGDLSTSALSEFGSHRKRWPPWQWRHFRTALH